MILNLSVPAGKIEKYTTYTTNSSSFSYPILSIDRGSYIVSSSIESGINFDWEGKRHHVQIGKYTSIAHNLKLNIDLNHDYKRVAMGEVPELKHITPSFLKRKGEIIIGNDVWIGSDVSIMGGVTIHNGAVVAANSVVTKDVPPYAIVGGNPAQVIKYRCSEETIKKMYCIGWWNWAPSKISKMSSLFELTLDEFANSLEISNPTINSVIRNELLNINTNFFDIKNRYLLLSDFTELQPITPNVIDAYVKQANHNDSILVIYVDREHNYELQVEEIMNVLNTYSDAECQIMLYEGTSDTEKQLLLCCTNYITNRSKQNLECVELAYQTDISCLSGFSYPIF